jgi:hypothetical protein
MGSNKSSLCPICGPSADGQKGRGAYSEVTIEGQTIVLCRSHAALVAADMPATWDELREMFVSVSDRRSPIPRRNGPWTDRRFFPRPEGRRQGAGRRTTDPIE